MCNECCKGCVVLEQGACFGLSNVLDCPLFDCNFNPKTAKSLEKSDKTDKNERGRE